MGWIRTGWTAAEEAKLLELEKSRVDRKEIARIINRSPYAIKAKVASLRRVTDVPKRIKSTQWPESEVERLIQLRNEGWKVKEIAARLNRSYQSVLDKIRYMAIGQRLGGISPDKIVLSLPSREPIEQTKIPDAVQCEWRRRQALSHTNLTAALCGDPLPGLSALDRRQ